MQNYWSFGDGTFHHGLKPKDCPIGENYTSATQNAWIHLISPKAKTVELIPIKRKTIQKKINSLLYNLQHP